MAGKGSSSVYSVPVAESIYTFADLADTGTTGAVTYQSAAYVDLRALATYHEGLLRVEMEGQNGQGGTPTSPGSGVTVTASWFFWNGSTELTPANFGSIGTALTPTQLVLTLPDSNSTSEAGFSMAASDNFIHGGRYIGFWFDRDAFAANALIDLTIRLVRL